MNEPVGLIAGAGRGPMLVAEGVLAAGRPLVVVGLRGFADPKLAGLADSFRWAGLTRPGSWLRFFHRHGVRQTVLLGSVRKRDMYCRFRLLRYWPDWRAVRLWFGTVRHDKRDNAVLLALADELGRNGVELISSVEHCKDHLAGEGVLTQRRPKDAVWADVEFGWHIVRESARLDIGQAIAVKERDIIAVEAMEGTDAMIHRAGELCRVGGWTLLKVARPQQDMRFDVPTVGPETIRNLAAAGCSCLVVEADRTLIADRPATIALADRLGVCVVGKRPEDPSDQAQGRSR